MESSGRFFDVVLFDVRGRDSALWREVKGMTLKHLSSAAKMRLSEDARRQVGLPLKIVKLLF